MTYRLPQQSLEWIDRTKPVQITFEGRQYQGYSGDTITSLLLANGNAHLGRSFKYHRIRGPLSLANHDVNAVVAYDDQTNVRSDITAAVNGINVLATNTIGGVKYDVNGILDFFSKLLPVGFYYKAFFKPRWLFPFWERVIRKSAGLGVLNTNWKSSRIAKTYTFCDVLVIGAGAAGLAAAKAAAEKGVDVILVDENPYIGGSLDYQYNNDSSVAKIRDELKAAVLAAENITVHTNAVASGYYSDHWIPVTTPQGIIKVRTKTVVMASGVFEQPAVFHNNDIPGVMLASAAQRLIARYSIKPCNTAVMLVANEEGYNAALGLQAVGVNVAAIIDLEDSNARGASAEQAKQAGISVYDFHAVYSAKRAKGKLCSVTVAPLNADGECETAELFEISCDGLLMSVGWAPAAQLLFQAGASIQYDQDVQQFVPLTLPKGVYAAGRVNGIFDLAERLEDGRGAGCQAAAQVTDEALQVTRPSRSKIAHSHPYPIFDHPKGKNFVDFDEDIQVKDLVHATLEGFDNIELLKRYSTIGMGPSQGKHSNMNAIRILAKHTGKTIDETGSTTARPLFHPVPLQLLSGLRFRPERLTPMHDAHIAAGAIFMEAGNWLRPEYYDIGKGKEGAILEEVAAVRNGLGLIDVSTLGKLEVFGEDVAELMDRLFTMRMSNLAVGVTRYALMVDEAGVIIDDGVAARYSENHYYFTTTTSSSDSAYRLIQRLILEWGLKVEIVNRTGQLAAMNLAGPYSRKLLQQFTDIDLSEESFPYLGARTGKLFDIDVTLLRVGFVGELGYEIHVRAGQAAALWDKLMSAGKTFGLRPFGVEAQRLLRLEKGHIIVGQDTDGLTNPYEASMGWSAHMKKEFFIGQRSLGIIKSGQSRKLHGFVLPESSTQARPKECHLVIKDGEINGRVTSASYSPTLQQFIGLVYIDDLEASVGDKISIRVDGNLDIQAELVAIPFYDPDGKRQTVDLEAAELTLEGSC